MNSLSPPVVNKFHKTVAIRQSTKLSPCMYCCKLYFTVLKLSSTVLNTLYSTETSSKFTDVISPGTDVISALLNNLHSTEYNDDAIPRCTAQPPQY